MVMQKWEYLVIEGQNISSKGKGFLAPDVRAQKIWIGDDEFDRDEGLNKLGEQGWELILVYDCGRSSGGSDATFYYRYFFKRLVP
ncbi:MAG TPA: hypothetical protein PKH77_27720 [Anaerolineae bacterium]|nr:hypothetical protein [Anaerolineae bacterium]